MLPDASRGRLLAQSPDDAPDPALRGGADPPRRASTTSATSTSTSARRRPASPALEPARARRRGYTTHRNHGHLIARGVDPAGCSPRSSAARPARTGGKGGTLHLASAAHGFPTTSSASAAAAARGRLGVRFHRAGPDRVSVCLFGDGALEEGAWHESVNIAALRELPVIFLCENNSLEALGQQANEYPSSTLAAKHLTDLAEPFGVPAVTSTGPTPRPSHDDDGRGGRARPRRRRADVHRGADRALAGQPAAVAAAA